MSQKEIIIKNPHLELIGKLFGNKPIMPRQTELSEFEARRLKFKKNLFRCEIVQKIKNGKSRTIYIPSPRLKKIQRKILRFLKKMWNGWNVNYCGMHHGSPFDHSLQHANNRYIFQFDIKDAFPSVNIEILRKVILQKIKEELRHYNRSVEIYQTDKHILERTKERRPDNFSIWYDEQRLKKSLKSVIYSPFYLLFGAEKVRLSAARTLTDAIMAFVTADGILPQGTPTAPFLFYIYLMENRCINRTWAEKSHTSCYVDGFVVSGNEPLSAIDKDRILNSMLDLGLKPNEKKTRSNDCREGAAVITGLSVDGTGKIRLPRKTIRKWRGLIHRTAYETDINKKKDAVKRIEGFIASLKPIYGSNIPKQIAEPLKNLNLNVA